MSPTYQHWQVWDGMQTDPSERASKLGASVNGSGVSNSREPVKAGVMDCWLTKHGTLFCSYVRRDQWEAGRRWHNWLHVERNWEARMMVDGWNLHVCPIFSLLKCTMWPTQLDPWWIHDCKTRNVCRAVTVDSFGNWSRSCMSVIQPCNALPKRHLKPLLQQLVTRI